MIQQRKCKKKKQKQEKNSAISVMKSPTGLIRRLSSAHLLPCMYLSGTFAGDESGTRTWRVVLGGQAIFPLVGMKIDQMETS